METLVNGSCSIQETGNRGFGDNDMDGGEVLLLVEAPNM